MLCDAVNEDEIYAAYMLYASLHGLSTDSSEVRERIANYIANVPDELVDNAILAYSEDRIMAPPDVVLNSWGKSRIYELEQLPCGGWRHQVAESWFENGCKFGDDSPPIAHFWTSFLIEPAQTAQFPVGTRLQFSLENKLQAVRVLHRAAGLVGYLRRPLVNEMISRAARDIRYLPLVDKVETDNQGRTCQVMVTLAEPSIPTQAVVEYTMAAFTAERKKC